MFFSVLIGLVFIIKSFFFKNRSHKAVIYLNLVVLFFTLNNLQIVLLDNVFPEANFTTRNLLIPFYALILPAFYTFVTYYLKVETKIKSVVFFTATIFSIQILIRIFLFHQYYHADKNYIVALYSQAEEIFNALFCLFIFYKSFVLVFKKSKLYENILTFDTIFWLKKFLFLGSIIIFTWIIAIVFNLDKVINPQIFIYYPLRLSSSILLFWLGYQGVFSYSLLIERILLRKQIDNEPFEKITFIELESQVTPDPDFVIIRDFIIKHKKYRNPNLSIDDLAKETDYSSKKISQLFKKNTKSGFIDYINFLRIERAQKILLDPKYENYTHIAIAIECGFNSKSTFYRVFKKAMQQTPTEYKRLKIS